MDNSLKSLDLDTLKVLYEKEASILREALLNGASWEQLRDQRKKVTDLSIVIHKKRYGLTNPAETSTRGSSET